MKVALINPNRRWLYYNKFVFPRPPFLFNVGYKILRKFCHFTAKDPACPIGLGYIAALLELKGHQVTIIDANIEDLTDRKIFQRVKECDPKVVGISSYHTPPAPVALSIMNTLAKGIKKIKRDVVTVMGGVMATLAAEELLTFADSIDYVVKGEGEITFLELIETIEAKGVIKNIDGVCYKDKNHVVINRDRPYIDDLDSLPFPARHLVPNVLYRNGNMLSTAILATRGCRNSCLFCYARQLHGASLRKRNLDSIADEIEQCYTEYGVRDFSFVDQTFTEDSGHIYGLIDEIKRRNLHNKIRWSCVTRVDCVNEKLLRAMKEAGCNRIGFGIECGSQDTLDFFHKKISLSQSEEAVRYAKENGILTIAFLLINQYREDVVDATTGTQAFLKKILPDRIFVEPIFVYPHSAFYRTLRERSAIKMVSGSPCYEGIFMASCYISQKELGNKLRKMYLRFYWGHKK